jgi:two-component system invasion response regulator UvrY
MKKILLAEDHSIVIKGITILFEAEFRDCTLDVVKNTGSLMNALKNNKYELIIVDLQLEDGDTLHLVTDILSLYPDLNILIFSGNAEEIYAQKLYKDGVKGYLSKQSDDRLVMEAIRTTMQGNIYISEKFKNALLTEHRNPSQVNMLEKLTSREMDVANLMQQGKRPSEICRELNLQSSTVATYKMKIYTKLNITNVIELKQLFLNIRHS